MKERKVDCQSHLPEVSLGFSDNTFTYPNRMIYPTLTPEQAEQQFEYVSRTLENGEEIHEPRLRDADSLNLTDVIVDSRKNIDTVETDYGRFPVGGFREDIWINSKAEREHFHLEIPAHIDLSSRQIIQRGLMRYPEEERQKRFDAFVTSVLPSVKLFSDKGVVFYIGKDPVLSLVPGPVIHRESIPGGEKKLNYNFEERKLNQQKLEYETEFFLEHTDWQVGEERDPYNLYFISRVSFAKAIDFNYINEYLKIYSERMELREELIRSLVNPEFVVLRQEKGTEHYK